MASHYEAPIRKPLVLGDKGYHDVTVDIAAPVEGKANKQWWIVFTIALVAFLWGLGCIIYTISTGIGVWGLNKNRKLGMGYHQLCMVGRYRSRRYLDFSGIAVVPSEMENGHQPLCGSDDHLLGDSGRSVPDYTHGASMVRPIGYFPIPNQFGSLWVNFNSPLLWDVFAISTYLIGFLGVLVDWSCLPDFRYDSATGR